MTSAQNPTVRDTGSLLFTALGWKLNSSRENATTELISLATQSEDIKAQALEAARKVLAPDEHNVLNITFDLAKSALRVLERFGTAQDAYMAMDFIKKVCTTEGARSESLHMISDAVIAIAEKTKNKGIKLKLAQLTGILPSLRIDIAMHPNSKSSTFLADLPESELSTKSRIQREKKQGMPRTGGRVKSS